MASKGFFAKRKWLIPASLEVSYAPLSGRRTGAAALPEGLRTDGNGSADASRPIDNEPVAKTMAR